MHTSTPRAWIGVLLADIRFPGSRSLKDRRGALLSLIDRLRNLGFSVARTGPADLVARAWIAATCASGAESGARRMLEAASGILQDPTVELGALETDISLFDPGMEADL